MNPQHITFRIHAIQRMFSRSITSSDVRQVLEQGQVIEDYQNDTPYPSQLILGWIGNRPIHIVVAYNSGADEAIVITAYQPDPAEWDAEFKRRRK